VYNPDANRFLVVWHGDHDAFSLVDDEFEIWGQLIDADTMALIGGNFRISDMGPDGDADYAAADANVAYDPIAKRYLVVWAGDDVDDEEEIYGQLIDGFSAAEAGANDFRISDMGSDGDIGSDAGFPAVAFSILTSHYLVVWHGTDGTDELEIYGQLLNGAGLESGPNDFRISHMGPDGDPDYLAGLPGVSYNPVTAEFLVAWVGDDDTGALVDGELEVFGQRLSGATEVGPDDFRISDMGPDGNTTYGVLGLGRVAVAHDTMNGDAVVVWAGDDDRGALVDEEREVFAQRLDSSGAAVGGNDFRLSDMGPDGDPDYGAALPAVAYRGAGREFLAVWAGVDDRPPLVEGELEIFGQRWSAFAPPVADTVGLVDPSQGLWYLRNQAGQVTSFFYGNPGDYPVMGDWDCNGVDTPGMYRQSDGFVYLRNTNTQGIGDIRFFFGNPGDIPIVGDFNADGCDTVAIYRPSEGRFYIINALGENEGGLGAAEFNYLFGNPGDKPFIGDFDGDGTDTVGLHRESTGFVYFRNTHTQGIADAQFFFGDPADRLVAGDWGVVDGVDTPAVFRPSNTTFFFRHTNTQGNADTTLTFGQSPWLPVAGTFGLD
jgi:hypothetical protein